MLLKIFQAGEPVLRQTARRLSREEILGSEIQGLIQLMQQTMYSAPGVGLAAPQIGENIQLAVIEDRSEYMLAIPKEELVKRERKPVPFHVIINPKITWQSEATASFFEGCLSTQGLIAYVPRSLEITVECLNERAEPVTIQARGWYARILQHEIQHLQGTLCVDHMLPRSLMTIENYMKYWKDKPIEDVLEELKIKHQSS